MSTLLRVFDKLFFSYSAFNTLGLLRIVLCYYLVKPYFALGLLRNPGELTLYDGAYQTPILIRSLSLPFPPSAEQLPMLHLALFLCAGMACVGLFTRITLFVTGFLNMYFAALTTSSGMFNHEVCLICQVLMFMAFAPGVQSVSLDRLLLWAFKAAKKQREPLWPFLAGPAVPVWGTQLILILIAVVYFTAGFSKVRFTGWRWLDGRTLTYYVSDKPSVQRPNDVQRFISNAGEPESKKWKDGFGIHAHHYGNFQTKELEKKVGRFVTGVPAIMISLSVLSVLFEMGAPLMLLGGWFRIFVLISAIALHQGIGFLMGLPFNAYKVLCFLMLDWELIFRTLAKRVPLAGRVAAILFPASASPVPRP